MKARKAVTLRVKTEVRVWLTKSLIGLHLLHYYHWLRSAYLAQYSDEEFAQRSHKKKTGSALDLDNPTTFDERQWWLKLYYRDPLMITCTDKIAVRKYVESCGLGDILRPLLGVYSSPDEIDWDYLPVPCYIKANHSSGTNIRCENLDELNVSLVRRKLNLFLKRNHYALSREWNYRGILPGLLIEPVIEENIEGLLDYRVYCKWGKCQAINVDANVADMKGSHRDDSRGNFYDRDWNQIPVEMNAPPISDRVIPRPARLAEMLDYAERLAAPFPFCRVDFYYLEDQSILFGEITFFNTGGNNIIKPKAFETVLGSWVALPDERPS